MPLSFNSFLFTLSICFSLMLVSANAEGDIFKGYPVSQVKKKPRNIFDIKRNFSHLKKKHVEMLLRSFVQASGKNRQAGEAGHKLAFDFLLQKITEIDKEKSGILSVDSFRPDLEKAISFYKNEFKEKVAPYYKVGDANYMKAKSFTDSKVGFLNTHKKQPNLKGRNLIWEKRGSLRPNEVMVFSAHYDTMTIGQDKEGNQIIDPKGMNPGADKNASGVASALALIKVFSHMELPITVRFVFYDWEEWHGQGSYAYFKKYKDESKRPLAFINLEALGHDSKTSDKEKRHRNMRAYISRADRPFYQKEKVFLDKILVKGRKGIGQPLFKAVANGQALEGDMGRWQDQIPAVTFSQNWQDDPNYKRIHTANDFVETLNFSTLHQAVRFIGIGTLAFIYDF